MSLLKEVIKYAVLDYVSGANTLCVQNVLVNFTVSLETESAFISLCNSKKRSFFQQLNIKTFFWKHEYFSPVFFQYLSHCH